MKKIILFASIVSLCLNISLGQNFKRLANFDFKTEESYKAEENNVLKCANYLFKTPAEKDDIDRLISIQFIMKWMTGTPDYSFEIGEEAVELTKGNQDLFGLYMAALTKVVLENKGDELSSEEVQNQSEKILVKYCSDRDNNMKPSKKIKKLIKADK